MFSSWLTATNSLLHVVKFIWVWNNIRIIVISGFNIPLISLIKKKKINWA